GPLVNYGYEDEVLLLTDITAAPSLAGPAANLAARADWLVCKEICIPEGADLALALPVAPNATPDPRWGDAIARVRAALPQPLESWTVKAIGRGAQVALSLQPRAGAPDLGEIHFFPYSEGKIEAAGRQTLAQDGSALTLTLPVASQRVGEFTRVAGVLTSSKGFGGRRSVAIDVPLEGVVVAGPSRAGTASAAV